MRPHGLKVQHIRNIRDYYENTKGWSSGPHLFTDEDQIWGMCPFSEKGVHARSFNSHSVGIEVLGNYDLEDPHSGRGLACWKLAAATGAAVLARLGIPINKNSVKFPELTAFSWRIGFGMTGKSLPPVQLSKFDPVLRSVAPSNP